MGAGASNKRTLKIMLVGLDNSGKTTFLKQVRAGQQGNGSQMAANLQLQETAPTVGYSAEKFGRGNFLYHILDMSGQSKYRDMWNNYCRDIEGIVFVLDASDSLRLQVAANELEIILEQTDIKNRPVPILFLANKTDLPGALSPVEVKEMLRLAVITDRKWEVFQTNSIKGQNVDNAFSWLTSAVIMAFPKPASS